MFSGIVEEKGLVKKVTKKVNLCVLEIQAKKVLKGTKAGNSVAVNGVCLTVTKVKGSVLTFDLMLETLKKTNLGRLKKNDQVNLERSLKMSSRIDGHYVMGHVDDMAQIKNIVTGENYTEIQVGMLKKLAKFIAQKGSICIDGVSLTIGDVKKDCFSVYLIPFTLDVTTLGIKKKGDFVNIEIDILARYIINKHEQDKRM